MAFRTTFSFCICMTEKVELKRRIRWLQLAGAAANMLQVETNNLSWQDPKASFERIYPIDC